MTDNLFRKAAVLTDVHFGRSGNSPVANADTVDFVRWFVDEARTWGAEKCIMAGDWHDNRHSLHVSTLNSSLDALELLDQAFEEVIFLPGNHDLFYRDKRDVSSIEFVRKFERIKIIRQPCTIGNVTLLPWLVGEEHRALKNMPGRYCFAHLEIPGFILNGGAVMPDGPHTVKPDQFAKQEYVFSGHFHGRQMRDHIVYMGNIMPFDFSDNWTEEKGMMLLEWGKEPEFRAWPDQPLYRTMKLSDLIANPDRLLRPKLTARVTIDIDISYEEAQAIKDEFVSAYGLRKIELAHQAKQEAAQEYVGEAVFQSLDQIVIDGLMSVQSIGVRPERLVEIYKSLG